MASFSPQSVFATVDDVRVMFSMPDGLIEELEWNQLNRVRVEVIEIDGNWTSFLILDSNEGWNLYQHSGFRDEEEVLDKLYALPEFNRTTFNRAYVLHKPGLHVCWVRDAA